MLGPKTQIAWQDKRALFKSVNKILGCLFLLWFYFFLQISWSTDDRHRCIYSWSVLEGTNLITTTAFFVCNNFLLVPSGFLSQSFSLCSLLNYLYKSGLSFLSFQQLKNIFSPYGCHVFWWKYAIIWTVVLYRKCNLF